MSQTPEEVVQEKIEEIKSMSKTSIARKVIKTVVRHSVSAIVARTVKQYVPAENKKQKLELAVGSYVVSGMFADNGVNWAEAKFDETVEFCKSIAKRIDEINDSKNTEKADTEETPE